MGLPVWVMLAGALALAAPAVAAEPSVSDYVKDIQAASGHASGSANPAGGCENGEERDASGACPIVDDNAAQRGFTLFSGSMARPQASAASATTRNAAGATAAKSSQMANCSLCDLKVNFKPSSAELTPDSETKLARFAQALRDPTLADRRFEIGGHTDASGSAEQNRILSQERADAVKAFLVAHGVQASRLQAKGFGAEGLAYPDLPRDPRNRRVEARVLN